MVSTHQNARMLALLLVTVRWAESEPRLAATFIGHPLSVNSVMQVCLLLVLQFCLW